MSCSPAERSAVGDTSFGLVLAFLRSCHVFVSRCDRLVMGRAAKLELAEIVGEIPDAAFDASILTVSLIERVLCVCDLDSCVVVHEQARLKIRPTRRCIRKVSIRVAPTRPGAFGLCQPVRNLPC